MFQIKYGLDDWIGIYPTDDVYVPGTVLDITLATSTLAETSKILGAATGHYLGFLMQEVTATGRSFIVKETNVPSYNVALGDYVSIRQGPGKIVTDVVAAYGSTGDMSNAVRGDNVSAFNGVLRITQVGVDTVVLGRYIGVWNSLADGATNHYIQIF